VNVFSRLKNFFLESVAADPVTNLGEGRLFWDSVLKKARVHNGSSFEDLGGGVDLTGDGEISETYGTFAGGSTSLTITSSTSYGETFLATATGDANVLAMYARILAGSTGEMSFSLYATLAGVPTGPALGVTKKLDITALSSIDFEFHELALEEPVPIVSGTTYCILLDGSLVTSGQVRAGGALGGYADGTRYRLTGGVWSVQSDYDLGFKVMDKALSGAALVAVDKTVSYNVLSPVSSLQKNLEILDTEVGVLVVPQSFPTAPTIGAYNLYTGTGDTALYLPSLSAGTNVIFRLKDAGGNAGFRKWSVDGGVPNIDGQNFVYMLSDYSYLEILWDGTALSVLSRVNPEYVVDTAIPVNLRSHTHYRVNQGAPIAFTLPYLVPGRKITIQDVSGNASTNNITVNSRQSETIDGVASPKVLTTNNGVWHFRVDSFGTNWVTL